MSEEVDSPAPEPGVGMTLDEKLRAWLYVVPPGGHIFPTPQQLDAIRSSAGYRYLTDPNFRPEQQQ